MVQSWFLDLILQSLVKSMCKVQKRSKSKDKELVEIACSKRYQGLNISTQTTRLVYIITNNILANKFTSCSIKTNKDTKNSVII